MNIPTDKNFKYDLEKLDCASDEFILVKGFFEITYENRYSKLINKCASCSEYSDHILKIFHIYKVNENNPIKAVNEKRNNLMLFHGTNKKGVTGILKEGFKNSKRGWFGQGVYMSDCSNIARTYSEQYNRDGGDSSHYMFVNEVLGS